MVQAIPKVFHGNYFILVRVICEWVKTENESDKYPNIIEDYETSEKLFIAEYIFVRAIVRENTVPEILP